MSWIKYDWDSRVYMLTLSDVTRGPSRWQRSTGLIMALWANEILEFIDVFDVGMRLPCSVTQSEMEGL